VETDGCVTTNTSAAADTDPPRTTARNAVSCVTVIANRLRIARVAKLYAYRSAAGHLVDTGVS
jgi:hypothetical protein